MSIDICNLTKYRYFLSHFAESNCGPHFYEKCALPTELKWHYLHCSYLLYFSEPLRGIEPRTSSFVYTLISLLQDYIGTRLYLVHIFRLSTPCQSFGLDHKICGPPRSYPLLGFNRNSGFADRFPHPWAIYDNQ